VVPLLEALQTQRCLHLVLPLVEGGDLFDRVAEAAAEGHDGLSQHEARGYFRDVVTGLLELKACGIAHGCVL
jgi:serine/threonine protein kinase